MPYVDYAEWFRREQARRGQGQVYSPSSTIRPIKRVDTPTSFEQIGGRAVEIGKEELKGEIRNRVAEALAPSAAPAATSVIAPGVAVPSGYTAVGTAASGGTIIAPSSGAGYGAGASTLAPGTTAVGTSATGGTMVAPSSVAGSGATAAKGGASTAGSALGTAASAIAAAKGGYDLSRVINKRQGATAGAMAGATLGAGTAGLLGAAGLIALGPLGIGAGLLLGAGGGAGLGKLFSPRQKNLEKERWKRLEKYYGFTGLKPEWVDTKDAALKAQDKTLGADYVGYNDKGQWVNNKFANSGKDADLKAQDIQQFATNFETFGKEYSALPEEKKLQMMDIALRNGLVTEQKGTVDINWTPETYQEAANILFNDPNVQKFQSGQPKVYEAPGYVPPWERK
jgi:hypothetical protein